MHLSFLGNKLDTQNVDKTSSNSVKDGPGSHRLFFFKIAKTKHSFFLFNKRQILCVATYSFHFKTLNCIFLKDLGQWFNFP